jgi:hypothetical protein
MQPVRKSFRNANDDDAMAGNFVCEPLQLPRCLIAEPRRSGLSQRQTAWQRTT